MLTIQNLDKSFGKRRVLAGFSYAFGSGVYGLLGPNGAGKTTLLRCLTQIYPTKPGAILYGDKPIARDGNYLAAVGYLPQKFGLFKELKVGEALRLLAALKDVDPAKAKRRVEECLELVALRDRMQARVGTLSGGMIRRLGIAQALLADPQILLFDEPTAGLDPEERLRFQTILSEIKSGRTVLLSTHIVEDVEACCDAVLVLKDGAVAASGSCAELAARAEGKTWLVPEAEASAVVGESVLQRRFEAQDGQVMLKILARAPQPFPRAEPRVEDGYLCVLKGI